MYETFDHTADLGLRIVAADLKGLFEEAARALMSVIVANPAAIGAGREERIVVEADELRWLFFDWMSELLHRFEVQHFLVCRAKVKIDAEGTRLEAAVFGDIYDAGRHRLDHEVKAVTYHRLRVERIDPGPSAVLTETRWLAEVILDI